MGDFNAKVGRDWETWKGALGKFGYGEENSRGERLLNFCLNNNLTVMNTAFYQRKASRKWTWESPDGKTRNMIDFILVNNRWRTSVTMCRAFSRPDVASDHKLILAGIRIKLRTITNEKTEKRFDVEKLEDNMIKWQYDTLIQEKWRQSSLGSTSTVEETWREIRTIYTETAQQVLGYREKRKKTPWISKEVLEMSDQRRAMKATKTHCEENRKKYNKMTREIKKKAKQCKEQWLEEKCNEAENSAGRQDTRRLFQIAKEICGNDNPKSATVKDKEGKVLEDKADIKNRWKEYYETLYNEENPVDSTVLDEIPSSNSHEHMEDILEEEVEAAIRNLKKRKAPGEDNITAEMIQAGERCSVEMLHTLCNKIYYEKKCPTDWGKAIIVPIHKKKDRRECSNYRGISLLSIPGKVYTRVLQQRMRRYIEEVIAEEQAGFRTGRGTIDQLFVIRQLAEKYTEKNKIVYNNFIDFRQAFDSVWQKGLWQVLRNYGIPEELVLLLEDLYSKSMSAVRVDGELTEWFRVTVGARQGCGLSPYLFNLLLEAVMGLALETVDVGATINGQKINNLRFADDIDLVAEEHGHLQELTDKVNESSKRMGLQINVEKTKTMIIGKQHKSIEVKLEGRELEQVTEFVYLGGLLTEDGQCTKDIKRRIGLASAMFGTLGRMWKSRSLSTKTKVKIYGALVIPVLLYGSECWCLRKEDERRLLVAEMSWLRRMIGRSRRERIRNEVTRQELGHESRMTEKRRPATVLYGHVDGVRSRGRQRKTWLENVKEDLRAQGMDMREAMDKIRNRTVWRSCVKASSLAHA